MSDPHVEADRPSLASLRGQGAQRLDPARFHFLEVLSARTAAQPDEVKRVLLPRLDAALADYAQRFAQAEQATADEVARLAAAQPQLARELRRRVADGDQAGIRRLGAQAAQRPACEPLAQLNRHLQNSRQAVLVGDSQGCLDGEAAVGNEMQSLRRFRETWSRLAADEQLDRAMTRAPDNAGPLNSHMLVLRSLALMREHSPDYLRRFLSHLDSLLWLEEADRKHVMSRRARLKK